MSDESEGFKLTAEQRDTIARLAKVCTSAGNFDALHLRIEVTVGIAVLEARLADAIADRDRHEKALSDVAWKTDAGKLI